MNGKNKKGLPRVVDDDDLLGDNPMISSHPSSTTNTLHTKKRPPTKDASDEFLNDSPLTSKKLKPAPIHPSPSSSSPSPSSTLRRSASGDSDDFLYVDPFQSATNKDADKAPTSTPPKHKFEGSAEEYEEYVKKLKLSLEKELEPTIPHLIGVWKGSTILLMHTILITLTYQEI
jgi:hypothetical protein